MGRDTFHHARVLQALSSLALDTSRDPGAATASVGNLCWTAALKDVVDVLAVLMEGSDGLDEEIVFSFNEDVIIQTLPCSAVVPAALAARNMLLFQSENGTGADVVEALGAVFTGLLHSLREPLAPCVTFQLCDKAAEYPQLYQFNQYYRLWMPKQSQEPVVWNP